MEPAEISRWMLWLRDDGPSTIILVVDDSDDDELTGIIAREEHVPSPNFGGVWGSGQADGHWLVGFHLIQLGGGIERQWFTDNIHRPLLEAVLDVPHLVAIVPEEIAGDAKRPEEIAPRFGGALILEVDGPLAPGRRDPRRARRRLEFSMPGRLSAQGVSEFAAAIAASIEET